MPNIRDLDKQIEDLFNCKFLPELEVKALQCLLACERHPASCSQAAVSGADDHSIIFWHNAFPPFHVFLALIKYLWQYFNPNIIQLQENCQNFIS